MAELNEAEGTPNDVEPRTYSDAVSGPDSLGVRIHALKSLDPGKLGALAATADRLQRRAEDAEAKAADLEWIAASWWVVQAPDGSTWHETDEEEEARAAMRPCDTLLRQYIADAPPAQYRVVDVAPPLRGDEDGRTFTHG